MRLYFAMLFILSISACDEGNLQLPVSTESADQLSEQSIDDSTTSSCTFYINEELADAGDVPLSENAAPALNILMQEYRQEIIECVEPTFKFSGDCNSMNTDKIMSLNGNSKIVENFILKSPVDNGVINTISERNDDEFLVMGDNANGPLAIKDQFSPRSSFCNMSCSGSKVGIGLGGATPSENLVIGKDLGVDYSGNRIVVGGNNSSGHHGIVVGESSSKRGYMVWNSNSDYLWIGSQGGTGTYFSGNVGIGISTPANKLDVAGTIRAEEIIVETGWADFVFDDSYRLRPLEEVDDYIKKNGHLPEIRPEADVVKNGVPLGDSHTKLLQKVEELTLYLIEQNKQIKAQKSEIEALKKMTMDR